LSSNNNSDNNYNGKWWCKQWGVVSFSW